MTDEKSSEEEDEEHDVSDDGAIVSNLSVEQAGGNAAAFTLRRIPRWAAPEVSSKAECST